MKKQTKFGLWSAASLASGLLALSGCGGGGGGASSPSTPTVGVNIQGASWVAFQDGANGAWQVLSNSNQAVSVNAPDGRYAIAYVCGGTKPTVNVVHALRSELPQVVANCASSSSESTLNVEVSLQGMTGSSSALVGIGSASGTITGTGTLPVAPGTYDVIGVRVAGDTPNKLWLERNRTFNANSTYTINFGLADNTNSVRVVDVDAGTLSLNGLDSSVLEQATVKIFLQNSVFGVGASLPGDTTLAVRYPIPPSGVLQPSERIRAEVDTTSERGGLIILSTLPSTIPFNLLAPYNSPSFSVNSSGPVVFTVNNFAYTGSSSVRGYLVSIRGEEQDSRWSLFYSAGWLGSETQITTPSLSNLSAWNSSAWDIQRGLGVTVSVRAYVSSNASLENLRSYIAGNSQALPVGYEVRYVTANSDTIIP